MFLPKIAFRKTLLSEWVETFVACYWCRWKVQDMIVRVVFFILKLVREFLSDGELNTAWNREKIAMSQGFARYWVTLIATFGKLFHSLDPGLWMHYWWQRCVKIPRPFPNTGIITRSLSLWPCAQNKSHFVYYDKLTIRKKRPSLISSTTVPDITCACISTHQWTCTWIVHWISLSLIACLKKSSD